MKNGFFKITVMLLCAASLVLVSGCKNKDKASKNSGIDKGRVAILFGYGYTDADFMATISEMVEKKYGINTEEKEGLVDFYLFPDDFQAGGTAGRISKLADYIIDENCKALITVGAPEFTGKALAKIKDSDSKCFVISLFSQDDVLGTEADSDIVIDFVEDEKPANSAMDVVAESNLQHMDKIDSIIMKMLGAVANTNKFTVSEEETSKLIEQILGSEWQVAAYLDSTTGLRSKNHFVLKYNEKALSDRERKSILNKKKKQDSR